MHHLVSYFKALPHSQNLMDHVWKTQLAAKCVHVRGKFPTFGPMHRKQTDE